MRLSEFIRENEENIVKEWEDFARELPTAPDDMTKESLRDHVRSMLEFIARYLQQPQQTQREIEEAKARVATVPAPSAAQMHGDDRVSWGFNMDDMVAEFRALRASVIRLWEASGSSMLAGDLLRFNEAIDQVLAESIRSYTTASQRQARLLLAMLSGSSDHACIFDQKGKILYINRAMASAYGKPPDKVTGMAVDDLAPALAKEVRRQIRHVMRTGSEYRGEFTERSSSGNEITMEYLFAPVFDAKGRIEAIARNARDVTDRKVREQTLWKNANHDYLTGVPNRRLFFDRLEQDVRMDRRSGGLLALLYVDHEK
jgi:PAS domain S-box-containing protein